jgi:hypothetical protein
MKRFIATKQDSKYKLKSYMATRTILGVKDPFDRSDLAAASNGNPTNMWYWHLGIRNCSSNTIEAHVFLRIRFYVVWFNPITVEEL